MGGAGACRKAGGHGLTFGCRPAPLPTQGDGRVVCESSSPACLPSLFPRLLPTDLSDEAAQLAGRVRAAAAFMSRLDAALKGKLGMKEVEALLAQVGGRAGWMWYGRPALLRPVCAPAACGVCMCGQSAGGHAGARGFGVCCCAGPPQPSRLPQPGCICSCAQPIACQRPWLLKRPPVAAALRQDPKPVPDPPGVPKLEEGLAAARDWLERAKVG